MTWGRALSGANAAETNGKAGDEDVGERKINVIATGSVDLTVKIWTP